MKQTKTTAHKAYYIISRLRDTVMFAGPILHKHYGHTGKYADCVNPLCVCHKLQESDANSVMFSISHGKANTERNDAMIINTLVYKDGWLCVELQMEKSSEPMMTHSYYPILQCSQRELEYWNYPIGVTLREWMPGVYYDDRGARYELVNAGQTTPIAYEETPLPKPRGKQVRWANGHWEKFTQAHGWHKAY